MNITNSTFTGNKAPNGQGGAIYNGSGIINIIADNGTTSFTGNTDSYGSNAILLQSGTLNLNAGNGGTITFNDKITSNDQLNNININKIGNSGDPTAPPDNVPTDGEVIINETILTATINLYNGTLKLGNEQNLNANSLGLYGGTLNLINSHIGTMELASLTLGPTPLGDPATTNLKIDADLAAGTADKLTVTNGVTFTASPGSLININAIKLLSDSKTATTDIQVADSNIQNYVQLDPTLKNAESALYKYNLSYNSSSGNLSFFNSQQFTASIITPQVSTLIGSYLTQTNTYHEAFGNMDSLMFMPKFDRLLMQQQGKTASADENFVFSPTMLPEKNKGLWFKQFTSFENVPLNNGPNVSNVSYGAIIGGDTELQYIGKGFYGYLTPYIGYSGSHQNYDQVGTYQNGGLIGLTGTAYKGDFFVALTTNVGATNGNANTTWGTDNFTTLVAGAAVKTGYNFELLGGKFIIQPSYAMSYTFANTFDYTTASGANITSNPLNAIQISPGVKFIGNLKDGWQPYIGVSMVWNIMDSQKFYANDTQLPQMSIAPYVEYGVGLQRRWGERFTGFGQAMARGGGRNGVALQFGFRYAIGK